MPIVFIDANILLGFWCWGERRVASDLLSPLLELQENLLITRQVVDEVNRNKLNVFLNGSKSISDDRFTEIPSYHDDKDKIQILNKKIKHINDQRQQIGREIRSLRSEIAERIAAGSDHTTLSLILYLDDVKTQQ
jgi:hypothetical protein